MHQKGCDAKCAAFSIYLNQDSRIITLYKYITKYFLGIIHEEHILDLKVIVVGSGLLETNENSYPAAYEDVIAVGAFNQ